MPYYREPEGDYLYVSPVPWRVGLCVGRAAAIIGLATSVQTTAISREYLEVCEEVREEDVPRWWLDALKWSEE